MSSQMTIEYNSMFKSHTTVSLIFSKEQTNLLKVFFKPRVKYTTQAIDLLNRITSESTTFAN